MKSTKVKTVAEYLARVTPEQRAALEKLHQLIHSAAPKAEVGISYQIVAFRLNGMLVGYGATARHCAFYLMSASVLDNFQDEIKGYETSKGTIRFQPDKPLPAAPVRKLMKAGIEANRHELQPEKSWSMWPRDKVTPFLNREGGRGVRSHGAHPATAFVRN